MLKKARFPLMALGLLALLTALWSGLVRLGWTLPLLRPHLPAVHGPLIVCGFLGTLTSWCEEHEVPYQGVAVGTIKRFIAGKGNADKQAVIDAVRARGFNPSDDNEADALAILLWAIETQGGVR